MSSRFLFFQVFLRFREKVSPGLPGGWVSFKMRPGDLWGYAVILSGV
jgi:hypothetical protein